ncbi:MAG: glycosyltransferase [Lachnospiraceae bacterium]|nr:glycosyltransferase [Lachnospiraceae bacterium]
MENRKPEISVITVTLNSAETLADTMRSVLSQTYLPAEYIVIDGCSSDGTIGLVEEYRDKFEDKGIRLILVSEPDNGIYDAMNKGAAISSGDVVGIINSDDYYEDCALETVADAYEREGFGLFYADVRMIQPSGRSFIKHARNRSYATSRDWNHPTTFIARSLYDKYKYRTDSIHDDYDLILRLKRDKVKTVIRNKVLANFRMRGVSHRRSLGAAASSVRDKYRIYRRCGYSRFYLFECVLVEAGKLLIG